MKFRIEMISSLEGLNVSHAGSENLSFIFSIVNQIQKKKKIRVIIIIIHTARTQIYRFQSIVSARARISGWKREKTGRYVTWRVAGMNRCRAAVEWKTRPAPSRSGIYTTAGRDSGPPGRRLNSTTTCVDPAARPLYRVGGRGAWPDRWSSDGRKACVTVSDANRPHRRPLTNQRAITPIQPHSENGTVVPYDLRSCTMCSITALVVDEQISRFRRTE